MGDGGWGMEHWVVGQQGSKMLPLQFFLIIPNSEPLINENFIKFYTTIDESNSLRYIYPCVRSEPLRAPRRNTASRRCPF